MLNRLILGLSLLLLAINFFPAIVGAQTGAIISGKVTLEGKDNPLHDVDVFIVQLKRTAHTDDEGKYVFDNIPPGTYTILAHLDRFPDITESIQVTGNETIELDLQFRVSVEESVTVTATGSQQTTFETIQQVTSVESIELTQRSQSSLGEVLDNQPGVAKRSFGSGSSRPVLRGFDGDRVQVLNDGVRSGSLASQSADHGETVDVLALDRVEILKGPATLLYGSNAIGGVVNTITGHHEIHSAAHEGLRGYATGLGGTNNASGGGSFGLEYGIGKFLLFGNGGGQRSGDYETPIGSVPNSKTRISDGSGGFGYYGEHGFLSFGYAYQNGRYGVPFASKFEAEEEERNGSTVLAKTSPIGGDADPTEFIDLGFRRHNIKLNFGLRDLPSFFNSLYLSLNYSDYRHKELENNFPNTIFDNREFVYRGVVEQNKRGVLSGSFGFSGYHRNYDVTGAEALSPPVDVDNFAVFTLQEFNFEHAKLQLGGRVENNRYEPIGLPSRSFTGFSGGIGVRIPIMTNTAFVANYTTSYRAPALEELYNNGPHVGTLSFEIGNTELERERNDGIDLSLRYSGKRWHGELNFFYYNLQNFVFLAPTGNINEGLIEAQYRQADSRYVGSEANFDYQLHPNLTLFGGVDVVDAELKATDSPLPRIPPLRGRVGFDARYKGFSFKPEVIMARAQNQIFFTETPTAGYSVVNLLASYTVVQKHLIQIFSVNAFNLTDRLYRNHLSLIKDLAP